MPLPAAADIIGLVSDLGGPEVPGIGFAVGIERLIACLPEDEKINLKPIYLLPRWAHRRRKLLLA